MRIVAVWLAVLGLACSSEAAKQRFYDRGEQYLAAGQLPEAIIEFRNAVSRDERWGQARLRLADAYAAHAEPELAYRQYIRAADLLPDDPKVQLKAAAYLLLAGQYDDAQARAENVLRRDPANVEAQVALGSALAGLRDLDGAVTRITDAIQLDPGRSPSYMALARVRIAQGQVDEARAAFDRAVAADGRSVVAHLARANFQWSVGEVEAAEASLRRTLEIDATNVLSRRALAALYLAASRAPEAEPHLRFVAEHTKSPPAWLSLADYYSSLARYEDARRVLQPLTAETGSRGAAETRLANIAYVVGSPAEGKRLLAAVLAREPNQDLANALNARWLLEDGKPMQALEHVRTALSVSPELIPALYLKATAEARTHNSADAVKTLLEVLRLNPRDAEAQIQLSALHLARNQVDSAVHMAQEALRNAPDGTGARLALVRALTARRDYKGAAAEIAAARKQAPASADTYVAEGALRLRMGDRRAARLAFERALELDPASREALKGVTTLDVLEGDVRAARARIEPRVTSFAGDPELTLLAGKVYLAAGDTGRAEQLLRQAIALDPLEIESVTLLARVLTQRRKLDPALAEFDAAAASDPRNVAARVIAAVIVHTQGKVADAAGRYESILKIEPRAALVANNLAAIYAEQGAQLAEAQRLAEFAVEQRPTHAGIRDTLGSVYLRRQLLGPAIVQFQESVAAEPNNALYHYHLGLALSKSGETKRARDAFKQAIRLNPRFGDAQQALSSLD
jgi:tetratricopeptide (TPR) repeat protein